MPLRLLLTAAGGLALALAFMRGRYSPDRTRFARRPILFWSSAALVGVALTFVWQDASGYSTRLAIGMVAACCGDYLLGQGSPRRLAAGILAFSLTQAAYVSAYLRLGEWLGISTGRLWLAALTLALVCAGLFPVLLDSPSASRRLRAGLFIYLVLLGAMGGAALGLVSAAPRLWPLVAGATLFMASDFILGRRLLRHWRWPHLHDVVWLLYIAGQALIVWSPAALGG